MGCIKGKSICETCAKEFEWRKHDSQSPARFCNRKCTNRNFGITGNKNKLFWPNASEEQKKERIHKFYESKVIKQEGCWSWKSSLDKDGYPQIFAGNTKVKGHRVSYEIHKGQIPNGMIVCHSCDNPKCTNPDHLWLGTKKQNSEDEVQKGRSSRGEDRWNSILTENDVKEIKKMLALGVTKANLSRKYKVSFMTISLIGKGKTWKHVKDLNGL